MNISDILKTKTSNVVNLTKDQIDKTFDYTKLKSEKLKDKIDLKIQEKAVLKLKAKLAMKHKSFEDYNDEELEIMLFQEKEEIKDDLKTKSLVAALAIIGLDFLVL